MAKTHRYGKASEAKLLTCDNSLRKVFRLALQYSPYDIAIIHGWRGKDVQNALFDSGASHKRWPESKHNAVAYEAGHSVPKSEAVDFAPWVDGKIPWEDTHVFALVAGCILSAAFVLKVDLRWGGDWDSDGSTKDQTLMDWGHVEVING